MKNKSIQAVKWTNWEKLEVQFFVDGIRRMHSRCSMEVLRSGCWGVEEDRWLWCCVGLSPMGREEDGHGSMSRSLWCPAQGDREDEKFRQVWTRKWWDGVLSRSLTLLNTYMDCVFKDGARQSADFIPGN